MTAHFSFDEGLGLLGGCRVFLSVSPSVYVSLRQYISMPIHFSSVGGLGLPRSCQGAPVCSSMCLPVCICLCLYISVPVEALVFLGAVGRSCLSVCSSVHVSVCLYMCMPVHFSSSGGACLPGSCRGVPDSAGGILPVPQQVVVFFVVRRIPLYGGSTQEEIQEQPG